MRNAAKAVSVPMENAGTSVAAVGRHRSMLVASGSSWFVSRARRVESVCLESAGIAAVETRSGR